MIKDINIRTIHTEQDKRQYERDVRKLWKQCFGDPQYYEDYYFESVYPKNRVYIAMDEADAVKGMIHLNPYMCRVAGHEIRLQYLVGIATHEAERRKGIMRMLLERTMADLYREKAPFAYLMPADVRYYEPFSFVSVSNEQKERVQPNRDVEPLYCYMDYQTLKERLSGSELEAVFMQCDTILGKQYGVYAVHDQRYFENLYLEKHCQEGDVVFVFIQDEKEDATFCKEKLIGFFAYARYEGQCVVEQYGFGDWEEVLNDVENDRIDDIVGNYFAGDESVSIYHEFPYMIRVVDAQQCMELFVDCFAKYAREQIQLRLTDAILVQNNGVYDFWIEQGQVHVRKGACSLQCDDNQQYIEMTIEELTHFIFGNDSVKSIYWAEIV